MGVIAMCVVAITLVACSDDERASRASLRSRQPIPVREEPTYRAVEVTESGTIRGNVRWRGERPEPHETEVLMHGESCGASQPSRALFVSAGGGISDVVVSIDIRRGAALPEAAPAPVIDNVGCRFEPHVTVAGIGTMIFRNSDDVLHNVHGFAGDDTVLDLGLPQRGAQVERTLGSDTVLRLVCDVGHAWQQAWVHVFEHPYYAITDERGQFVIPDVPPGQYALRLWHEGWRVVGRRAGRPRWSNPVVLSRSVIVSTEHETTVDFELSAQLAEIAGE